MRWLDIITDSMGVNVRKLLETVEDRGVWRAALRGVTKSRTPLSNWTATTKQQSLRAWLFMGRAANGPQSRIFTVF